MWYLSKSSVETWQRCPKEFWFRHVLRREPCDEAHALAFGKLIHGALAAWWKEASPRERLDSAMDFLAREPKPPLRPLDHAKAGCLLRGYTLRWPPHDFQTLAVEHPFVCEESKFRGEFDVVAVERATGDLVVIEHKTVSADIGQGSAYWRHVSSLNLQASVYLRAEAWGGRRPKAIVFDALRKPTMSPHLATPEADRKYTKPTKAEPLPRLYAGQRDRDESLFEFSDRLSADIAARPEFYFQRMRTVRLEHEVSAHIAEMNQTAALVEQCSSAGIWPKAPGACMSFGKPCDFMPVCEGLTSVDGPKYRKRER